MPARHVPAIERLYSGFTTDYITGCWVWNRSLRDGYGILTFKKIPKSAHRVSYELHVARLSPGQHLDHVCQNRACVNFSYLRVRTARQNACNLRGKADGKFSSVFPGVTRYPSGKWIARIYVAGAKKYLGSFDSEQEAGAAYRSATEMLTPGDM